MTISSTGPAGGTQSNPFHTTRTHGDELSAGDLLEALWRKRLWILLPTLIVAILTYGYLITATPRYTSEARVLVEDTQSIFSKAEREQTAQSVDPATVASHVQLLLARDVARNVIAELNLTEVAEFDPLKEGVSLPMRILSIIGLVPDPRRMSPEERALHAFSSKLSAFQVDNSRVIAVRFTSRSPQRAAQIVNAVADTYIELQQEAKRRSNLQAANWLGSQIADLRQNVADAEAKVEAYRSANGLLRGANDKTLPNSQLAELNTRLAELNAQHAEAKARAQMIRDVLNRGGDLATLADVLKSTVIQQLSEQRVTLERRIAELSSTLLPKHPRMRELQADLADLKRQIAGEARKIVESLESEARIAAARETAVRASLNDMKQESQKANSGEVQLRSLEREAKAQREILESFLARYREASARQAEQAAPAEARIVSRGTVSNTPSHPKKIPIFLIAVGATLLLSMAIVVSIELMAPAAGPVHAWAPVGAAPAMAAHTEPVMAPPHHFAPHAAVGMEEDTVHFLHAARNVVAALQQLRQKKKNLRVAVTTPQRILRHNWAALNLARVLASDGLKVMLIDANMRTPRLSRQVALNDGRGFVELLKGECEPGEVVQQDPESQAHLIACGGSGQDVLNFFEEERIEQLLASLQNGYDVVMIDTPPVLLTRETQMLAGHIDAAIMLGDDLPGGNRLEERASMGLTAKGARNLNIVMADPVLASAPGDTEKRAA